jgi:hypothetical protein
MAICGLAAALLCFAAATAALAAPPPSSPSSPFAQFVACMKAHGAPALGHKIRHRFRHDADKSHVRPKSHADHMRPSPADVAAWKQAFAACRDQLPKRPSGTKPGHQGDGAGHGFTPPTAAQVTAFKACMAAKGFTLAKGAPRPDLKSQSVRDALKAALKACAPLLRPSQQQTG